MNELFPKIVEDFYARLERQGDVNKYYVAGGACRDYILGRKISDIDIYVVSTLSILTLADIQDYLRWVRTLYPEHKVELKGDGEYDNQGFIVCSIDTEIPIDFIVVPEGRTITNVVDEFTCHLSQVYMERQNGEVGFVYTDNFKVDVADNTITFVVHVVQPSVDGKYRDKLLVKYPEREARIAFGDIFK